MIGGTFALLAFAHFVVDFIFQTHSEAMGKSHDWKIRARHCLVYTGGMLVACYVLGMVGWLLVWAGVVLFASHFVEDTYLPVYWWAKYIRMAPGVTSIDGFKAWAGTPLGILLIIAVDQIIHLAFVLAIACFI